MPLAAVPAWLAVEWDSSLELPVNISYPAMVVAWVALKNLDSFEFEMSDPDCSFVSTTRDTSTCLTSEVMDLPYPSNDVFYGQYLVLNTTNQGQPLINPSSEGLASVLTLRMNTTCKKRLHGIQRRAIINQRGHPQLKTPRVTEAQILSFT